MGCYQRPGAISIDYSVKRIVETALTNLLSDPGESLILVILLQ